MGCCLGSTVFNINVIRCAVINWFADYTNATLITNHAIDLLASQIFMWRGSVNVGSSVTDCQLVVDFFAQVMAIRSSESQRLVW